jgi:hypothetical protein
MSATLGGFSFWFSDFWSVLWFSSIHVPVVWDIYKYGPLFFPSVLSFFLSFYLTLVHQSSIPD